MGPLYVGFQLRRERRDQHGADAGGLLGLKSCLAVIRDRYHVGVAFAAGFGAWLLKEGFGRRRVVAAATLAAGLVLMQAAG